MLRCSGFRNWVVAFARTGGKLRADVDRLFALKEPTCGVILIPVHLGVRNGLVVAHSQTRALATGVDRQRAGRAHPPTDLFCSMFHALGAGLMLGGVCRRSLSRATRCRGGSRDWMLDGAFLGGPCEGCRLLLEVLNGASQTSDTLPSQMLGVVHRAVTPHCPQHPHQSAR